MAQHTAARRAFASLEAVVAFLRAELTPGRDEPPDAGALAGERQGRP